MGEGQRDAALAAEQTRALQTRVGGEIGIGGQPDVAMATAAELAKALAPVDQAGTSALSADTRGEASGDGARPSPHPGLRPGRKGELCPHIPEETLQRIWDLHLQARPIRHIAAELCVSNKTVIRAIRRAYRAIGYDRKVVLEEKIVMAIERLRLVQREAWIDHHNDDERERKVLSLMGADLSPEERIAHPERVAASARYSSQRAQLLRVILDAEIEIARLAGLYQGLQQQGIGFILEARCVPANEPANRRLETPSGNPAPSAEGGTSAQVPAAATGTEGK